MTIVEIRASGGAGKTTIVRRIMARYAEADTVWLEEPIAFDTLKRGRLSWDGRAVTEGELPPGAPVRRKIIGYRLRHPVDGRPGLAVIGPYQSACGGCDAIPQLDLAYHLARREAEAGRDVLMEGRLVGNGDPKRTLALAERFPLVTVHLDVALGDVVAATLKRREAAGRETDEARRANIQKNCKGEIRGAASAARRLGEQGVDMVSLDRDTALEYIAARLGVHGSPERPLEDLGIGVPPKEAQASLWG